MAAVRSRSGRTMPLDVRAVALAFLGIAAVLVAQALAGVPVRALVQLEAALIVFGGTLGALVITHSISEVLASARAVARTFRPSRDDTDATTATILGLARRAHRRGLVSIEAELEGVGDPFLREGLMFALDERSPDSVRDVLSVESSSRLSVEEAPARLLESAAGYAPTFGILGAVLGLIHVMRSLSTPGALGGGIAVAFVATVYGLGLANLVLLPLAGRVREGAGRAARRRDGHHARRAR